jgi:hypothetical protein
VLDNKSIGYVDVCEFKYLRNVIIPDDKKDIQNGRTTFIRYVKEEHFISFCKITSSISYFYL